MSRAGILILTVITMIDFTEITLFCRMALALTGRQRIHHTTQRAGRCALLGEAVTLR